MASEIELKNTYLKKSENVIQQLRSELSLSRKELQISKDDLEVITTECDDFKKQVKKLIVSETDLVQKHAQSMNKVDNKLDGADKNIEKLRMENETLRDKQRSLKKLKEKERDFKENTLESMKVDYNERLKEKDKLLED